MKDTHMKDEDFEALLAGAHAFAAERSALSAERVSALRAAARAKFSEAAGGSLRAAASRRRRRIFAPLAAALAAAACAAISWTAYMRGSADAESSARAEIARLRAEAEETREIREEFARLVSLYGRETVRVLSQSSLDYESALALAEENYVCDAGGFRSEFRKLVEREKAARSGDGGEARL